MKRIVVVLLVLVFSVAAKFKTGVRVVAQYKGGDYWYAGQVTNQKGSQVTIKFYDGSTDTLPTGHVRLFDWKVDTIISCRFKRGEDWYPGTVKSVSGKTLHVRYDDGDEENISIAYCRTKDE